MLAISMYVFMVQQKDTRCHAKYKTHEDFQPVLRKKVEILKHAAENLR